MFVGLRLAELNHAINYFNIVLGPSLTKQLEKKKKPNIGEIL